MESRPESPLARTSLPSLSDHSFAPMPDFRQAVSPEAVLRELSLCEDFAECFAHPNHTLADGRTKSIADHSLDVARQYLKYFSEYPLFGTIGRRGMLAIILLHDIGKEVARRSDKEQHEMHLDILTRNRTFTGLNDQEYCLAEFLVGGDSLGLYLQEKIALSRLTRAVCFAADRLGVASSTLFALGVRFFQADSSAYSSDIPSEGRLDHLYVLNGHGKLQFQSDVGRLLFAPALEEKLALLESSLGLDS